MFAVLLAVVIALAATLPPPVPPVNDPTQEAVPPPSGPVLQRPPIGEACHTTGFIALDQLPEHERMQYEEVAPGYACAPPGSERVTIDGPRSDKF